ncbi:hypothetical protein ACHAPJ_000991 [Fusarium lateritium]
MRSPSEPTLESSKDRTILAVSDDAESNVPTPNTLPATRGLVPSTTIAADPESIDILEDKYIRESGAIELTTEYNEQQPVPTSFANDRANVARFQKRMLAAVTELVDYPRRIPYPNYKQLPRDRRAMSTAFYTIFNTSSPSSIANLLLRTIPLRVQDVLGKSEPKFGDLISLPEPTSEERACWLVYFDGTVRWQMEDVPDDPFVRRKTACVARRGKYVGSSVDFRGGGVRLDRHTVAAKTKHSGERRQLHHHELCQEGTETNLRVLAVFDRDPRSKPYVPLLETIFMALLGTFAGRESTGRHNPEPCYELYDKIRSCMGIPDIEGDGLNKALSIHQGMVGQAIGRQTLFCMICNRELKPDTSERSHSRLVEEGNPVGARRCQTCHRHFTKHKQERKPNADTMFEDRGQKREQHQLWVAAGNADVYGNPACAAPRVPGSSFTGFMADARCANCADYLNQQAKKKIPESQRQERKPQLRELRARNYAWTHDEDALLQSLVTSSSGKTAWKELVTDHFPQMTAQSLKERFALLKAERLEQNKKTPETPSTVVLTSKKSIGKTRAWTDNELELLKTAIKDGKTARSMQDSLPGRTMTAIGSKMSWLRKAMVVQHGVGDVQEDH